MARRVVPFQPGHVGEVFVRMMATGSRQWSPDDERGPLAVLTHASPHSRPREVRVDECDVVAMVVDDDKWAWAEPGPGGTSMTFLTPEAAAAHLERLGWIVTPPDAHAEPIGEPRFTVAHFAIPFVSKAGWWVVDTAASPAKIMNGPFSEKHLAQAEADDMNLEDSAR